MVQQQKKFVKKFGNKSYPKHSFSTNKYAGTQHGKSFQHTSHKSHDSGSNEKFEKKTDNVKSTSLTCHYCGGPNHFAKDCLLKMQDDKENANSEERDDVAYYTQILKEANEKKQGIEAKALIMTNDVPEGDMEVWSSGSEDEEVRRPVHMCLMAKVELEEKIEKDEVVVAKSL